MYEIEVMLGDTDESHIIRTIEYWDREKRRWPQRQHYAVLVAEEFTRRFFDVIQLLSHAVPIIAVRVSVVEADEKRSLHFSKVLDTYEEPDDGPGTEGERADEATWRKKADWTVDAANALLQAVRPVLTTATLNFTKNHIGIWVGNNNYMWVFKRTEGKSRLSMWLSESRIQSAMSLLDAANIPYVRKKEEVKPVIDRQMVEANASLMLELATIVKEDWES